MQRKWGLVVIIMLWSKTVNGGFNNSVVCVDGEFQRSLKFSLIIMVLQRIQRKEIRASKECACKCTLLKLTMKTCY